MDLTEPIDDIDAPQDDSDLTKQHARLKQSVDRLLVFYGKLSDMPDSFKSDELDTFRNMAVQYLKALFPSLKTTNQALQYLKIYCQINQLKQIQLKRLNLLNEYEDVVQFCQGEELVVDVSAKFNKQIQSLCHKLDELVAPIIEEESGEDSPVASPVARRPKRGPASDSSRKKKKSRR